MSRLQILSTSTQLSKESAAQLPLEAQARLYRMLSALVGAGIPLDRALDGLAEQGEFHVCLHRTLKAIESGHSIARSFDQGGFTDSMVLRLLHLGQSTGTLDKILESLADLYEWRLRLRSELVSRLTYPCILSIACALMVGLGPPLLLRPILDFLSQSGQTLPLATRAVIGLANALSTPLTWLVFLMLASLACGAAYTRWEKLRPRLERVALDQPTLGRFLASLYGVRFLKALLTCLNSGYPLLSSLTLASECSQSAVLIEQTAKASQKLIAGEVGSKCWDELTLLDPIVRNAIEVGLSSGKLEIILNAVLKLQDEQLRHTLNRALALLEPIVLGFMGLLVALCILATVAPMMALLQGIA